MSGDFLVVLWCRVTFGGITVFIWLPWIIFWRSQIWARFCPNTLEMYWVYGPFFLKDYTFPAWLWVKECSYIDLKWCLLVTMATIHSSLILAEIRKFWASTICLTKCDLGNIILNRYCWSWYHFFSGEKYSLTPVIVSAYHGKYALPILLDHRVCRN